MYVALGKITVPVAGTPVSLVSRLSTAQLRQLGGQVAPAAVHGVLLQAWHENAGKVFIGTSGLSASTGAEVGALLAVPAEGSIPAFSMALTIAPNGISLDDLYLDVDNGGEGVVVSVLVT